MKQYYFLRLVPRQPVSHGKIHEFLDGADIIFDEIDSLWLKLEIRLIAKEQKKPVIMITDNGDNIMIDIERYDQDENLLPFHGLISQEEIDMIKASHGNLTPQQRVLLSLKIVRPENAVERMQDSLLEVGKTLKTWPQLGTASTLAGAAGSYITRGIACGVQLKTGRMHLSLDSTLIQGYDSEEEREKRENHTKDFIEKLRSL